MKRLIIAFCALAIVVSVLAVKVAAMQNLTVIQPATGTIGASASDSAHFQPALKTQDLQNAAGAPQLQPAGDASQLQLRGAVVVVR